jgi:hypothetical protein
MDQPACIEAMASDGIASLSSPVSSFGVLK